jgi:SAM-dependent methyltransferase
MANKTIEHYGNEYFHWQKGHGNFGGWANLIKFEEYIKPEHKVIDFGCGGAFLLKNLNCSSRLGVEINPYAREQAKKNGIETVSSLDEVPDNWADVCISNNALEHVEHPLIEINKLFKKIKNGGKVIFVVPCETINWSFQEDDINQHLYSWGPLTLGNLFTSAGFKVIKCVPFIHKWPPKYELFARLFGPNIFHLICRIYGRLETTWYQIRIEAIKPQHKNC